MFVCDYCVCLLACIGIVAVALVYFEFTFVLIGCLSDCMKVFVFAWCVLVYLVLVLDVVGCCICLLLLFCFTL